MKTVLTLYIYTCLLMGIFAEKTFGDERVKKARDEFISVQSDILAERSQLSQKLGLLESSVVTLKAELLKKRAQLSTATFEQSEFLKSGTENINKLKRIRQILDVSNVSFIEQDTRLKKIGVDKFQTLEVFDESGNAFKGDSISIGPVVYWKGYHGRVGTVMNENDILLLKEFTGSEKEALNLFFAGKTVNLPIYFDHMMAFADTDDGFVSHLKKGGAAMIPLLLLAVLCLYVAIFRTISLFGVVHTIDELKIAKIVNCLSNGDKSSALELASELKRPLAQVIKEGVEHSHLSKESLEEILYERVTLEIPRLERLLAALAVGATAAPLLGLLGTVTGMISTFKQITLYGTGNASVLSGGISEALITTETGLIIAVPALIMHAWLARRVSKAVSLTQKGAIVFVNELKVR